ncbi:hypothetical protein TanjilG_31144 [Lupinus angustifolius]|uniref:Dof zinc finger protein n=1 Tax=Lupinus angustifolius TaxID=3871 RepID=A0A1J7GCX8_LUPAN|nr:PREDICTED: dof zinc finger protein PBF-like [Lupinus angustifolius]OIV92225.1 hypothetical protein TanjilG_31144 [Lupinus angustifolius]
MEQDIGQGIGGGENGGDMNQQPPHHPPPPQQPPQQCPRCDSMNTKFCYYNNYSLTQPRFFCKTCKRYWTQGGTLRNIPVGGSSRKGKRTKHASSSQLQLRPQPQIQSHRVTQEVVQLPNQPNLTTMMRPTAPRVVQPNSSYYQGGSIGGGGGYLSSFAAVHSMNPPPQPLDQSLNVMASSNSGLLPGFNTAASGSLGSQPYHPGQIYPQGFYPEHGFNYPSNMANHRAPDTTLWNTVSTSSSISGNTQNNTRGGASSSSSVPNHWPNLPGNGSHYQ